jgi:major outer membrane protein
MFKPDSFYRGAIAASVTFGAFVPMSEALADNTQPANPAAFNPPFQFYAEGGILLSNYTDTGPLKSANDKFGSPKTDFGGYGSLAIGRSLGNDWDWRVTGVYGSYMKNTRSGSIGTGLGTGGEGYSASVYDKFSFGTLDFDLGRTMHASPMTDIRVFGGLRAAWLDFIGGENFNDYGYSGGDYKLAQYGDQFKSQFFGVGPDLGVEGSWYLNPARTWSLFGSASGAIFFGQRNSSASEWDQLTDFDVPYSTGKITIDSASSSGFDTVGELTATLGLTFQVSASTSISLGDRLDYWIDALPKNWGSSYFTTGGSRNILSDMPFVRLNVNF